jgi:hypothetical protein
MIGRNAGFTAWQATLTAGALLIAAMLPVSATLGVDDPRGQVSERAAGRELIRKAREAVAAPSVRQQLTAVSASGKMRRFAKYISVQSPTKVEEKERILNGKVQFDFVLPDRFRRRITNTNLNGVRYTYTETVNGDVAWRHPPPPIVSSRGDQRVIDVDDVERSQLKYAHDARQNLSFYSLGWLLEPPAQFAVDYIYAGRVRDEGRVDEAVIVEAPNGFRPILLLDVNTFLPSGWVIAYVEPRRIPVIVEVASVSRQFISETVLRARREREARRVPPSRRELVWRFLDHEDVDGVRLPHRVTTRLDGDLLEELFISDFRINPSINPKKFEGRPEVR